MQQMADFFALNCDGRLEKNSFSRGSPYLKIKEFPHPLWPVTKCREVNLFQQAGFSQRYIV